MASGHDPARFWDLTMREVDREFRATAKIRERETNERLWLAWHIVALDRTEKLPKLETLMIKSGAPKPKLAGDQMLFAMKSIFLAFGGDPADLRTE
jgi:hypothetical protein